MKKQVGFLVLATLLLGGSTLYQYLTFQLPWHDAGHLFRIVLNLFEHGFFYSPDWDTDHFRIHFTPIFYVLAPLVRLLPNIGWFVGVHCLALIGAVWVYRLYAQQRLESENASWLIGLAFLFNPYLMAIHLYPHWEVFGLLAAMTFALCVAKEKWEGAFLALGIALTVKQDFWLYMSALSLILMNRQNWKLVAGCLVASVGYFALVQKGLYPLLYPNPINRFTQLWRLGATEWDVFVYLLTHPHTWLKVVTGPGLSFLLSLGAVALLSWRVIFALPILYLWVNATAVDRANLSYHYALSSLLLFSVVAVDACRNLDRWATRLSKPRLAFVGPALLLTAALISHVMLPDGLRHSPHLSQVLAKPLDDRYHALRRLLKKASRQESVYTQFPLASYVRYPADVYVSHMHSAALLDQALKPDAVVLDLDSWDHRPAQPNEEINHQLFQNPHYELRTREGRIYFYERRSP